MSNGLSFRRVRNKTCLMPIQCKGFKDEIKDVQYFYLERATDEEPFIAIGRA